MVYGLALGANPTAAPIIGVFVLVDLWSFARGHGRRWDAHWIYVPLVALAGAYLAIEAAALGVAAGSGGYGYSFGLHVLLNALWYPVVLIAPFTEPELFNVHRALLSALDGTGSFADVAATAKFVPVTAAHLIVLSAAMAGLQSVVRDGRAWLLPPHYAWMGLSRCSAEQCFTLPICLPQLF